jgi:probable F420-dependent oxidoreductase
MTGFRSTGVPKIGIFADSTDRSMPILELAVAIEKRGFTGLFLNEHPHLPVASERSSFPAGGAIPDRYAHFWCPYVALAMVAERTGLEVGPTVSLIAEHDPVALAKTIATLDVLTGQRFLLGVGWGWHREEFEAQGFPANVRAQVMEDKLMIMKALWTEETASYQGKHVSLQPSRAWPKPLSRPHPPVFGGLPASERNFRRLARWADGWVPMASWSDPATIRGFPRAMARIRAELEIAGRDPAAFQIMAIQTDLTPDGLRRAVHTAVEHGVERVNLHVEEGSADEVLPVLDASARTLHEIFRRG